LTAGAPDIAPVDLNLPDGQEQAGTKGKEED
jgi:hypothetical protein